MNPYKHFTKSVACVYAHLLSYMLRIITIQYTKLFLEKTIQVLGL